jgi:hypothetical protein
MGTKKYWLEICVRFSITNFRFDSGVDNRIIIVWEKNEKKNISKRISQISSFILCVSKRQPQLFFFFFFLQMDGLLFCFVHFPSFIFFFCRGQQIGELWNANCFIFLGCVFDLIFFFFNLRCQSGNATVTWGGGVVCMCDEYYSRHLII